MYVVFSGVNRSCKSMCTLCDYYAKNAHTMRKKNNAAHSSCTHVVHTKMAQQLQITGLFVSLLKSSLKILSISINVPESHTLLDKLEPSSLVPFQLQSRENHQQFPIPSKLYSMGFDFLHVLPTTDYKHGFLT